MYVTERFTLAPDTIEMLAGLPLPFGYDGLGEFLFYRTYSRSINGKQETWLDCVTRVVNGTFSIRKDHYIKNKIEWDEAYWQKYAVGFARAMYLMQWSPPGRGLWAMGTDFIYERGSMALNNCGFTKIGKNIGDDLAWLMDALMNGVGVGFEPIRDDEMRLYEPIGEFDNIIPDTREGWVDSIRLHVDSYTKKNRRRPRHVYDKIRRAGEPIRGFGGVASGPEPLKILHDRIDEEFAKFGTRPEYDSVYLKTNLANMVGCCVVAGNVRRSAELCKGKVKDPIFIELKNYDKFPEREAYGWMSNNSVALETDEDFAQLGLIAERIKSNGEPGYINLRNMKYGRVGKSMKGLREDEADGFNPCGEMPQEDKELCNIGETYPTRCGTIEEWYDAAEYCAVYCQTVSILPTHSAVTNKVIARNRRIGVGLVDYTGWIKEHGVHNTTRYLRRGYKRVRSAADRVADEAGVPRPIRYTTVKPGGTVPKLAGRTSGCGYPTFKWTLRRVRVAKNAPVHPLLIAAKVPHEEDYFDKYTDIFEFPIIQGPADPASTISIWQQASNLTVLQAEWADNAVSNTLYFRPKWALQVHAYGPDDVETELENYVGSVSMNTILRHRQKLFLSADYKIVTKFGDDGQATECKIFEFDPSHEEDQIEPLLSSLPRQTKSVSMLPHSPKGAYRQMPEEGISETEYYRRRSEILPIDWSLFSGSDGEDEKYCTGPSCELPIR